MIIPEINQKREPKLKKITFAGYISNEDVTAPKMIKAVPIHFRNERDFIFKL